ncbi:YALIA101S04e06172g1_1 [Yarrowia lipolytica]|nr:Putative zinc transporter MSC2 [Yarrowia lipolytica]SEI33940.1 YALIA101S04e06172g1_1 [Yarrowia lipolytica]
MSQRPTGLKIDMPESFSDQMAKAKKYGNLGANSSGPSSAGPMRTPSWGILNVPELLNDFHHHTLESKLDPVKEGYDEALPMRSRRRTLVNGEIRNSEDREEAAVELDTLKQECDHVVHNHDCDLNEPRIPVYDPLGHIHDHTHAHTHDHIHDHTHDHIHDHTQDHIHDHSHAHAHTHDHKHTHDGHDHSHDHNLTNTHTHTHDHGSCSHGHGHSHSHDPREIPDLQIHIPPLSSLLQSIPSFISLPTSLLATSLLCLQLNVLSPIVSALLVAGCTTFWAGVFRLFGIKHTIGTRKGARNTVVLTAGIFALVISAIFLGTTRVTAIVFVSLNVPLKKVPEWRSSWQYLVYLLISIAHDVVVEGGPLLDFAIGYLALGVAVFVLQQNLETPSSQAIPLGLLITIPTALFVSLTIEQIILLVVACGSCGVFLIAKRDLQPNRINGVFSSLIGFTLDLSIKSRATPSEALVCGLSIFVPTLVSEDGEDASDKSIKKRPGLIDSIISHSDTRNIFYFLLLNFSFMLIQLLYSILSHSLGLLSDSIHMFFDCLALMVGLVASILSKLPPSSRFPYGLGKVETVSGFTNGCLLVAIAGGVCIEALGRIYNPVELERTAELLVVSALGLLVNIVGIVVFNHGHAPGEECSHGHSHGGHDHSEHNSNTYGIYLHIMADTLGSVGVIISTILTWYFGWSGFDPLASMLIAILIFLSALPLVSTAAKTLLLSLTDSQEYTIRNILNDISVMPGVASYDEPRFWSDGGAVRGTIHVKLQQDASSKQVKQTILQRMQQDHVKDVFIQIDA